MAKTQHLIMTLVLLFHIFIITVAGRDIPNTNLKKHDVGIKQAESFIKHDRGFLVPGIGRGIKPKSKDGFNPFTYNPVTGTNSGGIGGHVPRFDGVGGGSFMPGGDDTFVPNPGSKVHGSGETGSTAPGPIRS